MIRPLYDMPHRPYFIGIAGGTGSGKPTAAQRLTKAFPGQILLLALDDYYRDLSDLNIKEREQVNFDHPDAIDWKLLRCHIDTLRVEESVIVPRYDFETHTCMRDGRWVQAREVILLEGIWALYDDALTNVMDLRIYVDADSDVRILRRLQRDIKDRGRTVDSVVNQYLTSVKPMHEAFVVPSKTKADLVIPGDGTLDALNTVILKIQTYLKADSAD